MNRLGSHYPALSAFGVACLVGLDLRASSRYAFGNHQIGADGQLEALGRVPMIPVRCLGVGGRNAAVRDPIGAFVGGLLEDAAP